MTNLRNFLFSEAIEGKIIYVLGIVALVQFMYPITEKGSLAALVIYQILYASLVFVGVVIARNRPQLVRILMVFGVLLVLAGSNYALNPDAIWANLVGYLAYMVFDVIVMWILLQYVFTARSVTRDVIYGAVAIYLLLGAMFVPIYGLVETLTFELSDGSMNAFTGGIAGEGELNVWQDFSYYSFVTLTTLGYGDILPATMLAKVAVSIEAVIGVLYLTIIMARLVSLYSADVQRSLAE